MVTVGRVVVLPPKYTHTNTHIQTKAVHRGNGREAQNLCTWRMKARMACVEENVSLSALDCRCPHAFWLQATVWRRVVPSLSTPLFARRG